MSVVRKWAEVLVRWSDGVLRNPVRHSFIPFWHQRTPNRAVQHRVRSSVLTAVYTHACAGLLSCALLPCSSADTLRVTSWNLQGVADEPTLRHAADYLKSLHPDVVLLQSVRDWQMCNRLAEALKPDQYHVLICSAFATSQDGASATNIQVAVLAKEKAYFSWSEPWQGGVAGGFTFVALQAPAQRLGFVCAELPGSVAPESAFGQLRKQLEVIGQWEVNRVQSFVLALSCGAADGTQEMRLSKMMAMLQDAGYTDTLGALAADQRATVAAKTGRPGLTCDYLIAQPTVFPSPIRPRSAVMGRYAITCDLELDPNKVAAAWTARAQELQLRSTAIGPLQSTDSQRAGSKGLRQKLEDLPGWWWAVGGAMGTALMFLFWFVSRRGQRQSAASSPLLLSHPQAPAGIPVLPVRAELANGSSYTVVVSAPPESVVSDESGAPAVLQSGIPTAPTLLGLWQERALAAEREAAKAKSLLSKKAASSLTRWLKQKFVRKVVADRAQLLATQESAALQAMKVDERLARIENQIRRQTENYERRIEELTLELLAAREENRELIRARIAQVKLEMETVRARLRAAAGEQLKSETRNPKSEGK
jgi:hypothetical protein